MAPITMSCLLLPPVPRFPPGQRRLPGWEIAGSRKADNRWGGFPGDNRLGGFAADNRW